MNIDPLTDINRSVSPPQVQRLGKTFATTLTSTIVAAVVSLLALAPGGCGHSPDSKDAKKADGKDQSEAKSELSAIQIVKPEKRDLNLSVVQPGTIQSFEVTPIYSRISGYVNKYRVNIGDRVKAGDLLIDMWVPDLVEALAQKSAAAKRAEVQIKIAESVLKSNDARLIASQSQIVTAQAGVRKSQASYDRWDSEYRRTKSLAESRVLDEQVRDETYKQFEEAVATREQAISMVNQANADRDRTAADRDKARVDIDAARADLDLARADEKFARVMLDFGNIKAPYDGVVTRRNVNPGDYLQPGGGSQNSPLFVLEQVDPVRVFVGVPELYSGYIKDKDMADLRVQALPGRSLQGQVVRSGFSLNPANRTMQTEIDIPNPEGVLRPGMYVTVSIAIKRSHAFTIPSTAIRFRGQQAYLFLAINGKAKQTPIQIGPADDRYTEILRMQAPGTSNDQWVDVKGDEQILVGSMDAMTDGQAVPSPSPSK